VTKRFINALLRGEVVETGMIVEEFEMYPWEELSRKWPDTFVVVRDDGIPNYYYIPPHTELAPTTLAGRVYVDEGKIVEMGAVLEHLLGEEWRGNPAYKAGVEPVDLMRAGQILHPFAIGNIIKYAFRNRHQINPEDMDKIIHYAKMLKELAE